MRIKKENGVSLITLAIAIVILIVISNILLYNASDGIKIKRLQNMYNDIELIQGEVSTYYAEYGAIPASKVYTNNSTGWKSATGANDTGDFLVIDLSALKGITLNYGEDYKKIQQDPSIDVNSLTDLYIINTDSHNVFFVRGIEIDGKYYYTNQEPDEVNVGQYLQEVPTEGPVPTPEPPTGGQSFIMANGVIEIKWLSGNTNYVSQTANAPKIKTGANMELVKYDETSASWIQGEEYSYLPGSGTADNHSSKWANARVTTQVDGKNIESYFVWIPRYAYRIVYFDTPTSKNQYKQGTLTEEEAVASGKIVGYSDSRGIVDKDGKKVDSVASTTKINVGDYFMVHPAFTTDENNGGGWEQELEGLWIGKYEASRSDATNSSDGLATTIKVQPNIRSFRSTKIGDMYNYAISYSEDLKSHMLKNSEWGAAAYLTDSKYGRNGTEVTINNNSNYITGQAGDSISAIESTTTNLYNTSKGVLASSTGNVYGLYDLSGGLLEYLASYYKDGNQTYLDSGNSFTADKTSDEYSTVYEGKVKESNYKYGDATLETYAWNNDYANFDYNDIPFLMRGGYYNDGNNAGIFNFNWSNGYINGDMGFRLCLVLY